MSDRHLSIEGMGRDSVPSVEVERNVDEEAQAQTFANSTLQGVGDGRWVISIATYLDMPEELSMSQGHVVEYVTALLSEAAKAGDPGVIMFDVKVGPAIDFEVRDQEIKAREARRADLMQILDDDILDEIEEELDEMESEWDNE